MKGTHLFVKEVSVQTQAVKAIIGIGIVELLQYL